MRKRINRACVASSSNYVQSKKAHRAMLEENHINNSVLLLTINTTVSTKPLTDLERFEIGLKNHIEQFKAKRVI